MRASMSTNASAAPAMSPRSQLGLHQDTEQGGGPHPVLAHQAQAPAGGGAGQVVVAASQVQPGGGEQRLHVVVAAQQQRLGLGQPALEDPQLGQGDRGVPVDAGHDLLELCQRPDEQVLGLAATGRGGRTACPGRCRSGC